jgi:hypothetical protein
MQLEQRRPDVVRAISQRALLSWWSRLCLTARIPAYPAEPPEHLAGQTDNLMHCDVVPSGDRLRFRMRFIGSRLAAAYGGSWPGRFLDEALAPNLRDAAQQTYSSAVENERPVYSILETRDRRGLQVQYERLILPFSDGGTGVDRVITSVEMVSVEGAFEDRDIMVRKPAAPTYLIHALIDLAGEPPRSRRADAIDDDVVDGGK